ncbi:hypothetical protein IE077_001936 [Cardiosporidium cionae]|uniref:Dynactin subunit 2 n=1 Tax=Cardiosporidium cionae TaxID=476202 RepID=A0ABQ7J4R1_9APIC|nr:hypothetical protein IE077_001936 [Cardiosporidium cionae]|eukprot:KAF8818766.1 hypothetical protein IE077_001936 [Cardiosporidium cionae]
MEEPSWKYNSMQQPQNEKDVYEYIPEADTLKPNLTDSSAHFSFYARKPREGSQKEVSLEILDESIEPHAAYEKFKEDNWASGIRGNKVVSSSFLRSVSKGRSNFEIMPSYTLSSQEAFIEGIHSESRRDDGTSISQFETPLDRLSRLQNELKELYEFILPRIQKHSIEKSVDVSETKSSLRSQVDAQHSILFGHNPTVLLNEVELLLAQVSSLQDDPRLKPLFEAVHPITTKGSGYDTVIKQLDYIAAEAQGDKDGQLLAETHIVKEVENDEESTVTYELYNVPSMQHLLESSRVLDLEVRITEIENAIGMNKLTVLPFSDLCSAIDILSKRLTSLDLQKVEALSKRVQVLLLDLQSIHGRRKELLDSSVDDYRLDFLFDLCNRWKKIAASIPTLVKRLQMLRVLHQEATGVVTRLKLIETQQNDLKVTLTQMKENFGTLKQSMVENLEWSRRTMDGLKQRMDDLTA